MNSLYKHLTFVFCLGVVSFFSTTANATLIEADYLTSGDNQAVFDTTTGLTWLDLTQTANLSYTAAGLLDSSYRYATNTEVEDLFSQFTGANFLSIGIAPNVTGQYKDLALSFATLFGTNINAFSYGLYANADNILNYAGVYTANPNIIGTDWEVSYEQFRFAGSPYYGTYLVKNTLVPTGASGISAVPTPSTMAILLLGLLGIGNAKRQQARRN